MCRCDLPKHSPNRFCCAGCGRAFSSMTAFDAHRYTRTDGRRDCVSPQTLVYGPDSPRHGEARFIAREARSHDGTAVLVWGQPGTWTPSDTGERGE